MVLHTGVCGRVGRRRTHPFAQSFWVWVQGDSAPKTVWFWGHTCIPTRFGVLVFCGWLVGSCVLCFVVGVGGGFPEGPAAAPPRTVGGATRHAAPLRARAVLARTIKFVDSFIRSDIPAAPPAKSARVLMAIRPISTRG